MTDAYVAVQPDSLGKKIRTGEITDSLGNVVEQQVVQLADSAGNPLTSAPGTDGSAAPTQGIMVQGLVNDSPPQTYIVNEMRPVSITSDGRVRVSTEIARTHVPFFRQSEEENWGEGPSLTPGSPWLDF